MRRRLSLDTDYEEVPEDGLVADRSRKSRLRERLAGKMNLQICFVDDDDQMIESQTNGCSGENGHDSVPKANVSKPIVSNSNTVSNCQSNTKDESTSNHRHLLPFNLSTLFTLPMTMMSQSGSNTSTSCQVSFNSFPEYLDHLHKEAKKSLKAAKEMSRMQSQLEREQSSNQKQVKSNQLKSNQESKEEEKEDTNDPVIRINDLKRKSLKRIRVMEKDLVLKTNQLNSLLVKLLEEREELLMEQDSLLIDIEDLTQLL